MSCGRRSASASVVLRPLSDGSGDLGRPTKRRATSKSSPHAPLTHDAAEEHLGVANCDGQEGAAPRKLPPDSLGKDDQVEEEASTVATGKVGTASSSTAGSGMQGNGASDLHGPAPMPSHAGETGPERGLGVQPETNCSFSSSFVLGAALPLFTTGSGRQVAAPTETQRQRALDILESVDAPGPKDNAQHPDPGPGPGPEQPLFTTGSGRRVAAPTEAQRRRAQDILESVDAPGPKDNAQHPDPGPGPGPEQPLFTTGSGRRVAAPTEAQRRRAQDILESVDAPGPKDNAPHPDPGPGPGPEQPLFTTGSGRRVAAPTEAQRRRALDILESVDAPGPKDNAQHPDPGPGPGPEQPLFTTGSGRRVAAPTEAQRRRAQDILESVDAPGPKDNAQHPDPGPGPGPEQPLFTTGSGRQVAAPTEAQRRRAQDILDASAHASQDGARTRPRRPEGSTGFAAGGTRHTPANVALATGGVRTASPSNPETLQQVTAALGPHEARSGPDCDGPPRRSVSTARSLSAPTIGAARSLLGSRPRFVPPIARQHRSSPEECAAGAGAAGSVPPQPPATPQRMPADGAASSSPAPSPRTLATPKRRFRAPKQQTPMPSPGPGTPQPRRGTPVTPSAGTPCAQLPQKVQSLPVPGWLPVKASADSCTIPLAEFQRRYYEETVAQPRETVAPAHYIRRLRDGYISPAQAADYAFDPPASGTPLHAVLVDSGWCSPQSVGWTALRAALLHFGALSHVVTEAWARNHFRWVVWKLGAMELRFARVLFGVYLTAERVLAQLVDRYNAEYLGGRNSALRAILQRDQPAAKPLVLCIAGVVKQGVPRAGPF